MNNKKIRHKTTSFYLRPMILKQLEYLSTVYGENNSAVIARLIAENYTTLKITEQTNEKNNINE